MAKEEKKSKNAFILQIVMKFKYENETKDLPSNLLKYIIFNYKYQDEFMPIIYLSLAVTNDLYTKFKKYAKTARIYLEVNIMNPENPTAIKKRILKGEFNYILSSYNSIYSEDISKTAIEGGAYDNNESYRILNVALLSLKILNQIKNSFNGIYSDIDVNTMLVKALEGIKTIAKKPKYNRTFDTIIVPALNNKKKLINFIFNISPFYDLPFIYFVDFNAKAYLLDQSGEYVDDMTGDQVKSIYFSIYKVTERKAYVDGMMKKDGKTYYQIYINPAHVNVFQNVVTDKVSNQLIMVDKDGSIDFAEFGSADINGKFNSNNGSKSFNADTTKQIFARGDKANLVKNEVESNTYSIDLEKENIDASILTPNKEYIIDDQVEDKYSGKYTLIWKRTVAVNKSGNIQNVTSVRLKKVGDITPINKRTKNVRGNNTLYNATSFNARSTGSTAIPIESGITENNKYVAYESSSETTAASVPNTNNKHILSRHDTSMRRIPRRIDDGED